MFDNFPRCTESTPRFSLSLSFFFLPSFLPVCRGRESSDRVLHRMACTTVTAPGTEKRPDRVTWHHGPEPQSRSLKMQSSRKQAFCVFPPNRFQIIPCFVDENIIAPLKPIVSRRRRGAYIRSNTRESNENPAFFFLPSHRCIFLRLVFPVTHAH